MKTTITRAWIRETPHPSTGYTTYDVIVNIDGASGSFIESIHDTQPDAQKRASEVPGQKVEYLNLVHTH